MCVDVVSGTNPDVQQQLFICIDQLIECFVGGIDVYLEYDHEQDIRVDDRYDKRMRLYPIGMHVHCFVGC